MSAHGTVRVSLARAVGSRPWRTWCTVHRRIGDFASRGEAETAQSDHGTDYGCTIQVRQASA